MLYLHRSERADVLVEALADVLVLPLPDPFEPEVVSVPTRGVERWLTQRLSHRLGTGAGRGRSDGVCANVAFPFPGRLVGEATAAAGQIGRDDDPWRPERAVWPLLEVLDDHLGEPWLAPVAGHLGATDGVLDDEVRASRRFGTARHIADLYDRYSVHRPAMVRAWRRGGDVNAAGTDLGADAAWQPELWRHLSARIGVESPAERLDAACAALAEEPDRADLPARLALFGLTRLPASYLEVLRALAVGRDVHLFLLHPSPVLWDRIAGAVPLARVRRSDDPTADVAEHPLLRSWGRDAREMQLVLTGDGHGGIDRHRALPTVEATTLLHRLQDAVRHDIAPGGAWPGPADDRPRLDPDDRSVEVHACHGRVRQVEVVRDAILHLLLDDPTLEPRDVIVMCPDIEAFAPLIHATFGAGADQDEVDDASAPDAGRLPDLRVRLADRALRQTNPVLGALAALLDLVDARFTAVQVLDLAGRDPLRRRFQLDEDDLARLAEWVADTGIRWGLDGEHRAPYKLERVEQNTWRSGLDRVLAGVAMAEEDQRLLGGVLPLDDVDSGAIDLAGRFAELVDRLHGAVGALRDPMPITGWAAALADAIRSLMATSDRDSWQLSQASRLLDEVVAEATADGVTNDAPLRLTEVRNLLRDRLRGRPTRASFRTGHLTVCTLVPMRSVPHRVVCLLGLDDGAFPRRAERDDDDLVAAEPLVGDGDGRSEDRQLLLDALLAATDRLVITYRGHDERTNAERPPAVPVGELLDVIDATVGADGGGGGRARDRVVVHHPLQAFDPRNFEPGRLAGSRPWSFDHVTLAGARALRADPRDPAPFLAAPLAPPEGAEVLELDQLVRFVQHPVRAFLRQRLGISMADFSSDLGEAIPLELDALERWGIGERILTARLAGASFEACAAAERARGGLPPGALADGVLEEIRPTVECLVGEAAAVTGGGAGAGVEVGSVEVAVQLDDGRLLAGTVPGMVGSVSRAVSYSRVGPKHRLAAWVRFLALAAGRPADGIEVVTVGRSRSGSSGCEVTLSRFSPLADDPAEAEETARRHLHDLVALHDRGMREPLPLYCATSAAYAGAVAGGRDGLARAGKTWASRRRSPKEDCEREHQLVLGGIVPFEQLLHDAPRADEDGPGWDTGEATRFGRYARRLWAGPLAAERLEDR
jgi:exodeoxyribonuclease V gamma subunit